MFKIPNVILSINKDAKANKIAVLSEADALVMQRMFSGSVGIDYITGGGYAYKKVQILFGAKSVGKNAGLNQMIAYNQRLCRLCKGIRPDFYNNDTDRHTNFLKMVMGIPECKCDDFDPKKFLILDYEKSITKEQDTVEILKKYFNSKTGESVDELDYNETMIELERLKKKKKLSDEDSQAIVSYEEWLQNIKTEEEKITRISTMDYLSACGVLINELMINDPEDTEEGIEVCRKVIPSREIDGIIWDSLQAAIPKWVKERDAEQDSMGKEAKQNALLLRHISSKYASADIKDPAEAYKPAVFITSQLRSDLSSFFKVDTWSGGHAAKHHASLALEHKRAVFLSDDGTEANSKNKKPYFGQTIKLRAEKNKLAPPETTAEVDYYFKAGEKMQIGFDHVKEITMLGIKFGIIEQAGAWYRVGEEKFNGMEKLTEFCKTNPDFVGRVYKQLRTKF